MACCQGALLPLLVFADDDLGLVLFLLAAVVPRRRGGVRRRGWLVEVSQQLVVKSAPFCVQPVEIALDPGRAAEPPGARTHTQDQQQAEPQEPHAAARDFVGKGNQDPQCEPLGFACLSPVFGHLDEVKDGLYPCFPK